ncbi:hypothetical protein OVA14_03555 [Agrococcus sp. SL85]|uniref:TetR/AcrR family transcriptional regulator n=1 Tax=Agrococcus sp. SL85 TaxID=2995141 RepID=UPI00226C841E|nr:hypothetical protein [Agrococcus sp. SL85]WAC66859.1 hypothetical protein OVA14_03555 [Agrococcus sp. SL85]
MDQQPRRRDAERNRARILEVAAERIDAGESVAHKDLARAAEVGVGTVYRAFPARPDLITALAEPHLLELAKLLREATEAEDPLAVAVTGAVGLLGQHPDVAENLRDEAGHAQPAPAVAEVLEALQGVLATPGPLGIHQGVDAHALVRILCGLNYAASLASDKDAARVLHVGVALQGLRAA